MNKTRLDSLRVGERFQFIEDGAVYLHLGFDAATGQQLYAGASKRDTFALATIEGSRYVIPLDHPERLGSLRGED